MKLMWKLVKDEARELWDTRLDAGENAELRFAQNGEWRWLRSSQPSRCSAARRARVHPLGNVVHVGDVRSLLWVWIDARVHQLSQLQRQKQDRLGNTSRPPPADGSSELRWLPGKALSDCTFTGPEIHLTACHAFTISWMFWEAH